MVSALLFPKNKATKSKVFVYISVKYCKLVNFILKCLFFTI